ncbi:CD48 antigen-like isoform 2-T2 [Fundulus diaphanus]
MVPIMRLFRSLPALFVLVSAAAGQGVGKDSIFADPIYKKVDDSVVLNPGQFLDPISSVTWKQEPDLALDWEGLDVICYRDFKDRCSLNKKDGSLTISNLKVEDSGIYTPQINHNVLKKLELQVIEPVPKPTVSVQCNNEKTLCNLTCEANISPDVGTVTYRWRKDREVVLSNDKELIITTNKESSFICELENLVSSSSSDGVDNPIISGELQTSILSFSALNKHLFTV